MTFYSTVERTFWVCSYKQLLKSLNPDLSRRPSVYPIFSRVKLSVISKIHENIWALDRSSGEKTRYSK